MNSWSFIQTINIDNIFNEFVTFTKTYKRIKNSFANSTHNETYNIEFYNLCRIADILSNEIKIKFNQINPGINKRFKRGLVNGLGNAIKFITGNLDDSDAERYNSAIEILSKNQNKMKTLVKEQITLLEKTINKFDNTTNILMHNQDTLNKKMYILEQFISKNPVKYMDTYNYFLLNLIVTEVISSFEIINNMLEKVEVAITFSKLNIFHNSMIEPEDLLREIELISGHLTYGKLPFQPIISNILLYEKILSIKAYSEDNKITFILEIPIVENEDYVYYRLYPLPVFKNKNFNIIIPSSKYAIVNENKFALSNEKCKEITTEEFICENTNVLPIRQNMPCEIELINYSQKVLNCRLTPINLFDINIRKLQNSFWLVSTKELVVAKQHCDEHIENIPINGSYLIELSNSNCKIKINDIVIQSHKNIKNKFKMLNLPDINYIKANENMLTSANLTTNLLNINNFKDIHELINDQKDRINEFNDNVNLKEINLYSYILYCIILIVVLSILYCIMKCFRRNNVKGKYNIVKRFKLKNNPTIIKMSDLPQNSEENPIVL